MIPEIPPTLLALLCPLTKVEQAKSLKVSKRSIFRMISRPWREWRVGQAEKWCSCCGLSFWDLKLTPELSAGVEWDSGQPAVVGALGDLYRLKFPGRSVTRRKLLELGETIAAAVAARRRMPAAKPEA